MLHKLDKIHTIKWKLKQDKIEASYHYKIHFNPVLVFDTESIIKQFMFVSIRYKKKLD